MSGRNDRTLAWEYYERGRAFNHRLEPDYYAMVRTNNAFFEGNQWLHVPEGPGMGSLPRPVFNIIKRVAGLFVASLTSSAVTIGFEPLSYYDGSGLADPDRDAAVYATAEVRNLLEKFKMDFRVRDALFDGARTGDYCAHFWWDPEALPYGGAFEGTRGEIRMELVDGSRVMFGNPALRQVEEQPYILILGRDTVENLKREAAFYGGETEALEPDGEDPAAGGAATAFAPGGDTGTALYVYLYTRRPNAAGEDTVHVTKATRSAVIYEDLDTGLSRYPVAWGNWEKSKESYHGRALVTGILPNQIFINSMMAMVFRHLQLQSFPKTLYNADLLPRWSNELGRALAVHNLMPDQRLSDAATVLQPADMSGQIVMAIERVMQYTRECLGATDAQLGNVSPNNTSAIMVLQNSSEVPLENIRAGLYEWLEDIAAILLDLMGSCYGRRRLVREREFLEPETDAAGLPLTDPVTGQLMMHTVRRRVMEEFDFSVFKHLWLNTRVNAGATTYYSEIAMVQTLDNLRRDGTLTVLEYLERIPDRLIPDREGLMESIRARMETQPAPETGSSPGGAPQPAMGGAADDIKRLQSLPQSLQSRYNSLPGTARRALLRT